MLKGAKILRFPRYVVPVCLLGLGALSDCYAKTITVRARVQKHRTLQVLSDAQFEGLLRRVSEILTASCKARQAECQVTVDKTSKLSDLPDLRYEQTRDRLKYFGLRAQKKALEEEISLANKEGIFAVHATAALLDGTPPRLGPNGIPSEITIFVVQKISNGCPATPLVHVGGCAAISGSSAVIGIRPELSDLTYPSPGQWSRSDHFLWSHEVGHLMGLWDLDRSFAPTRLMGPGSDTRKEDVSVAEAKVMLLYPAASGQASTQLCSTLVKLEERVTCEPHKPGTKPRVYTPEMTVVGATNQ